MSAGDELSLLLRPATANDAKLLFDWRNDPLTRENSINQAAVDWTAHVSWLTGVLEDSNREILIAECGGSPVGMARLDHSGGSCELSWSVAPAWRRKGVGGEIVRQAVGRVRGSVPFARIKRQNDASTKIVMALGFSWIEQDGDVVVWQGPSATAAE